MSDPHPPAYAHDPPWEILPDALLVCGSIRMGPGMVINRNMVVLREAGELTLINPIRLSAEGEAALEAFGQVRHAVRLGCYHGVDDPYTVERFGAQFWCQEGSDQYPAPPPDRILEEGGPLPLADAELFVFRETKLPESLLLWKRHGGLLVSCDSLQHWESSSGCSPLAKLVTRAFGFLHPANIGPPWRRMMKKKGGSLRPDFDRILELSFEHLVGAHGQFLRGGARDAFGATVRRIYG